MTPPYPSGQPLASTRAPNIIEITKLRVLRFENETSLEKLLTNPHRAPLADHGLLSATVAAIAADDPRALARARGLLFTSLSDSPSIRAAWLVLGLSEIPPSISGAQARLHVADLRGDLEATSAYRAAHAAKLPEVANLHINRCSELANSLMDRSIVATLLSHPNPLLQDSYIAVLKSSTIAMLATRDALDIELGESDFANPNLFARPRPLVRLRRTSRRLHNSWSSTFLPWLSTVGTITFLLHMLDVL